MAGGGSTCGLCTACRSHLVVYVLLYARDQVRFELQHLWRRPLVHERAFEQLRVAAPAGGGGAAGQKVKLVLRAAVVHRCGRRAQARELSRGAGGLWAGKCAIRGCCRADAAMAGPAGTLVIECPPSPPQRRLPSPMLLCPGAVHLFRKAWPCEHFRSVCTLLRSRAQPRTAGGGHGRRAAASGRRHHRPHTLNAPLLSASLPVLQ